MRLLLLFVFSPFLALSQERQLLDWQFFKNDRPVNAEHQAYTWYNLSYKVKPAKVEGDRIEFQFEVIAKMDTAKSYFDANRRRMNDLRLLKHEQGHADIAFIYALKLKETFNTTLYSRKDFQTEIKNIWNKIFAEMIEAQAKYDTETNHSKNVGEQARWDLYFDKAVKIN